MRLQKKKRERKDIRKTMIETNGEGLEWNDY